MNELVLYLFGLDTNAYRGLLKCYLYETAISDGVLQEFIRQMSCNMDDFVEGVDEPKEWLENQAEQFCTPDPEIGFQFDITHSPTKKQPGRHS